MTKVPELIKVKKVGYLRFVLLVRFLLSGFSYRHEDNKMHEWSKKWVLIAYTHAYIVIKSKLSRWWELQLKLQQPLTIGSALGQEAFSHCLYRPILTQDRIHICMLRAMKRIIDKMVH
jgi:hypothetical protein